MENFGKFITIVLVMIITPIIKGFVFSKIWLWFIVPTFQIQPLRVVEAIGIMFLISFVNAKIDKETNKDTFWKNLSISIAFTVLTAAVTLLFGWVVKLFI